MAKQRRYLLAEDIATHDDTNRTLLVKGRRGFEIRVRSHAVARRLSAAFAGLILVVTAVWFETAHDWWDPCRTVREGFSCDEPAAWFRFSQMSLAAVGAVTGMLLTAYLTRFAVTGRIWRNSRRLAGLHGVVVLAWLIVWTVEALSR